MRLQLTALSTNAERHTALCAAGGARCLQGSRCCGADYEALPGPGRGERLQNVFLSALSFG